MTKMIDIKDNIEDIADYEIEMFSEVVRGAMADYTVEVANEWGIDDVVKLNELHDALMKRFFENSNS